MANEATYDVIIVGARLAGAATAMLLARAGLKVLVIDRQPPGADTLSTHAFMRGGVMLLSRWGALKPLLEAGTPLVTMTTFHYGDTELPIAIKPDAACPGLMAPRRTLLDPILVSLARAAGADMRYRTTLRELSFAADGRVVGIVAEDPSGTPLNFRARLVIGADGLGSSVARMAQARELHRGRHAGAAVYGYFPDLGNGGYHWLYRGKSAAGVIPTNDGLSAVFVQVPIARFDEAVRGDLEGTFRRELAEVSPRLAGRIGRPVPRLFAFRGRPGYLRQAHGPGWALVGDAGFFRDPLTAHGMTDALRDAEGLAAAVLRGAESDFDAYQAERDALARPLLDITDSIVAFDWTLDEVQQLHLALNKAMKAEVAVIAGRSPLAKEELVS